jgi:putative addiction module antidote
MLNLKVRKVGNSLSVTLPKEAAARLKVREGDSLFLTEGPEGGYLTRRFCNLIVRKVPPS